MYLECDVKKSAFDCRVRGAVWACLPGGNSFFRLAKFFCEMLAKYFFHLNMLLSLRNRHISYRSLGGAMLRQQLLDLQNTLQSAQICVAICTNS